MLTQETDWVLIFGGIFELCFPIGAIYCANSVGQELRRYCKTTAVTFIFRLSSAIVHLLEPNLSGGSPAKAKPVVMSTFYICTDSLTQSASNFSAKVKV